ncbi:MAG: hypothetical protein RLZZ450_896 [Pseudomonadota bacterium]|jgi:hypothetical protein
MTAVVPMLEDSLVWQTTGHLAETAISALVDGEGALLPEQAVQHAVSCSECSERVGLAALFALEVTDALRVPSAAREHAVTPLPVTLPALSLVLALVAGAPLLATLQASSPAHVLARLARLIAHAVQALRAPGVAELTWLAAALLVGAGVLVARGATRARAHGGGGLA